MSLACATPPGPPLAADAECFREVVRTLADDTMGGRGIGTRGLRRSGTYLGRVYAQLGLEPVRGEGPAPSYRQNFLATTGVAAGSHNRLSWTHEADTPPQPLRFQKQFQPFGFSSSTEFEGDVVFVGYGIVAEPLAYDDYAGVDVAGKVALAMRYEPGEADPDSPFDGKRSSRFSDLRYKALKAREAGAVALIFVSPPDEEEDRLPRTGRRGAVSDAGIPVIQVDRKIVEQWFASAGADFTAAHAAIEADYEPHSRTLPGVRVAGETHLQASRTSLENILGIFPGRGELSSETVVVGAHFDHLGRGGASSLTPDRDEVHNGADDNASGIASMVCGVAEVLKQIGEIDEPRRTLLVASFSGEESGLLGSNHYVRNPARPIEDTVAMVNLDMVGRLRERRLHAMGADSSPGWSALLEPIAARLDLDLVAGGDGYGPSDQMAFYGAGIPVIHLFTGSHPQYHTPEDDIEHLNVAGGARISTLLADSLIALLHREQRLAYQASTHGPMMAGDSRGFGAYLGSIPDYADMMSREGGVLLSGVRKGGPADQAGITGGDRIIEMDDTQIHNLYDMTFVLRDHRPGEIVEIVFLRAGEPMRVRATLGRRGKQRVQTTVGETPHAGGG
ncbi:MAG: M28 family peptidase [bacterium]|nr:M28 family peptidase [bacterium]